MKMLHSSECVIKQTTSDTMHAAQNCVINKDQQMASLEEAQNHTA